MASPLVGRDRETRLLSDAIIHLADGRGDFIHIVGEAGIGKSRLLGELTSRAADQHITVWATEADQTDRLRSWSTAEPLLVGFDPLVSRPVDRALRLIEMEAGVGPLLIVVDDVQWADTTSLEFIQMVARRAAAIPVLLVTAARPGSAGRQLDEFAVRRGHHLPLNPLGPDAVDELIVAMSCADAVGPRLAKVIDGAGGNPFLITEVLRDGALPIEPGASRRPSGGSRHALPLIDRAIVERVMGRLLGGTDRDSELLLRAAAALPPGFDCDELAAVSHCSIDEVMSWVLSLGRAGVLVDLGRGLAFRHSLLRDIVRLSMPAAVCDVLRRAALDVLGGTPTSIDRTVVCLLDGFNPDSPGEVDLAIEIAADQVARSPAACADLLSAVLPVMHIDDPRRLRVATDLGWSLMTIGRADDVPELVRLYVGGAARTPVELLTLEGSAMALSGRLDLAMQRYEGYDIARIETEFDTSDSAVVDAVAELASGWVSTGRVADGLGLLHWVEQSETPTSPVRTASVEATRALICGVTGRFAESVDHGRASLRAIARGTGPIVTPANPVISIALGLDLNGDSTGALAALRDPNLPGLVPAWTEPLFQFAASIVLYRRGDWDAALAETDAGLMAADEVGLRLSVFWPYAVGALVHLARNHRDSAAAILSGCGDAGASSSIGTEWLTYATAMLHAADGDMESAGATLDAVCSFLIAAELDALLLGFAPDTARLALHTGRTSSLPNLERGLRRLIDKSGSPVAKATAAWVSGLVSGQGAALAAASEQFWAVDRRPAAAHAAADAAVAFQRSGETLKSRRVAGQAFEEFDRLEAEMFHVRLRSELRDVGLTMRPRHAPSRATGGWQSLTPAEQAVVDLVVTGLTNGEVGDRLYVSRRTIESHMARVFTKLNLTSRTQLIAAHHDAAIGRQTHGSSYTRSDAKTSAGPRFGRSIEGWSHETGHSAAGAATMEVFQ